MVSNKIHSEANIQKVMIPHSEALEHRPSFSRGSHFAAILVPMVAGVSYTVLNGGVEPLTVRLFILAAFLYCLVSAITFLRAVESVEKLE